MASTDAVLLLQTCAVAAWGTAGGAILHEQPRNRPSVTLLGVGLLVGAIVTAIDSEVVGGAGLPLASWSLLLFGLLALVPNDEGLARALCGNGLRLAVTGALALGLLHWAHRIAPLRPAAMDLVSWQGIRLITATLLGWLAWRSPHANGQLRWLLGATAAGVGSSALLGDLGTTVKATLQCLAVMPILAIALRQQLAVTTIAAATAVAFGFTGALRASAVQQGRGPQLAGLDDPLLALAIVFGGFGIALHRAHQAMTAAQRGASAIAAEPAAAPTPVLPPTASEVVPPLTPVPASAPTAEPAPAAPIAPPNLTTSLAELEDFERLLQGTVDLASAPFDLHALLERSVAAAQPTLTRPGPQLQLERQPSLPRWLLGDAARVQQLFDRLLQLATAMETGQPVQVRASATDTVHIVIRNPDWTMPGRTRSLSLLFSQQLALTLGGELQLRTDAGDVLEIHLRLPNRAATAPGDPTTALRGRLLLIDDRSDLQRLLGHLLAQAGAEVTTAETAAEARQLLARAPFDLVLLDLELPDRDGSALAQELRQQGITVPIVALTDGSAAAGARSEQAGCNAHVDKPIDFAQLQQELSRHLPPATS
ncbi:MAG: response regulator [Planctomycetes bacterium]|jgi:CheY-like chemotaxis protein|nr:response regulator [Planctomycetota bacterium]